MEPQPHATSTEQLVEFGHVVFEIRSETDGRHADRNTVLLEQMEFQFRRTSWAFTAVRRGVAT